MPTLTLIHTRRRQPNGNQETNSMETRNRSILPETSQREARKNLVMGKAIPHMRRTATTPATCPVVQWPWTRADAVGIPLATFVTHWLPSCQNPRTTKPKKMLGCAMITPLYPCTIQSRARTKEGPQMTGELGNETKTKAAQMGVIKTR